MLTPFDFNLRHLRALDSVVLLRSLNRAAEVAGLSQPALTQGLSKLERQLGVRLFERHSGGVVPTPAGLLLTERVRRAFACLAQAGGRLRRAGARGFARPEQLMTSTQLEAFLAFAATQGFAGAAALSGMSQPGVHRAVRELEEISGQILAERRGRGTMLTAAGHTMARAIRLAVAEIAAGIAEARGEMHSSDRIALGAMPLSRALVVPHALAAFIRAHPGTVIDVVEGSWRELIEPLRDGIIDIVIGALRDAPPPGIVQEPLFTDELAIFGRRGHPLAGQPVGRAELRTQSWVVGPIGTPLRRHWEDLFDGAPATVPVECGSVMVIRGLVMRSDLLTLLSPDQIAVEVEGGMMERLDCALAVGQRVIGLTFREDWLPTAAQRHLIDLLRAAAQETRLHKNQ